MQYHQPALLKESITLLKVKPGGKYIDCTLGGGGHAEAVLKKGGVLLGIDWDEDALKFAKKRLTKTCPGSRHHLVLGDFSDLKKIAQSQKFTQVSGILFDLGASLHQLTSAQRGFSFLRDAPLDMRMSRRQKVTAADLVNALNKGELYALFSGLAQENRARALAQAILVARRLKKIKTTGELTQLIKKVKKARSKIHPATKAFLALRIAVNDELNNLKKALPFTVELLKTGGRLVILSYHSGEDRIVKYFFKKMDAQNILKTLTQKPIRPSPLEIKKNPASRSAKMRAAERL